MMTVLRRAGPPAVSRRSGQGKRMRLRSAGAPSLRCALSGRDPVLRHHGRGLRGAAQARQRRSRAVTARRLRFAARGCASARSARACTGAGSIGRSFSTARCMNCRAHDASATLAVQKAHAPTLWRILRSAARAFSCISFPDSLGLAPASCAMTAAAPTGRSAGQDAKERLRRARQARRSRCALAALTPLPRRAAAPGARVSE